MTFCVKRIKAKWRMPNFTRCAGLSCKTQVERNSTMQLQGSARSGSYE